MSSRKKIAVSIAAFVLIGVVTIVAAYEAEIRPIRAKVLAGGRIAETAVGKIEYSIAGDGMPLLSIHGAGGGYDQGLMIATALVGDGFKAIAPSRFGYLRTPVPSDASPAAQAMPMPHCSMCSALTAPLSWACPRGRLRRCS